MLGIEMEDVPEKPGCYRFYDAAGNVLYVGKAKNLRERLSYYAAGLKGAATHGRVAEMLEHAHSVEWLTVESEAAALVAEANLIAHLKPRYNMKLRDETGSVSIAITNHPIPRAMRWWRKDGDVRKFGPWTNGGAVESHLEALSVVWGVRTCPDSELAKAQRTGTPCLLRDLGRCSAPCVNPDTYDANVQSAIELLEGSSVNTIAELERRVRAASEQRNYETAAKLWATEQKLAESELVKPVVALVGRVDVLAAATDPLGVALQLLRLNNGVLIGVPTVVIDHTDNATEAATAGLIGIYSEHTAAPTLVSHLPFTAAQKAALKLVGAAQVRRARTTGEREAVALALRNAHEHLARTRARARRSQSDRDAALAALAEVLNLSNAPRHIECVDISHFAGRGTVASFSRLIDGMPRRGEYRSVKVREQNDDYASMREAVERRLAHVPKALAGVRTDAALAAEPDLLVIDGGAGQLNAARAAIADLGMTTATVALAKRNEEIWVSDTQAPLQLPKDHPALLVLMHARDEAHNSAKAAQLRQRKLADPLAGIKGLGAQRRRRLIASAGTLADLARWDRDRYRAETWLPDDIADAVWERLAGRSVPQPGQAAERRRRTGPLG